MNSLAEQLNPPQLEAVKHTEGPLLILAGAGSGKTRTITYRIWYLIEKMNIRPWNVLAVTFTNKAAKEMRDRVQGLLHRSDGLNVWVSTIHSACVRILRQHIVRLGIKSAFDILDANDQTRIIKKCISETDDHPQTLHHYAVLKEMSLAKNDMITAQKYAALMEGNNYGYRIAQVFLAYEKKLRENQALDFDDLLFFTWKLFQEHPDVLEYYQNRCQYIMVDEYQDTNHVQAKIMDLLAKKHQNICVVGDDDQSIYQWRGADIKNILGFEKLYPQTKIIRLEQNYRSTQTILDAANQVIAQNNTRKAKKLWTENETGEKITLYEAFHEQEESQYICRRIQSFYRSDFPHYQDFAILYRTNAQSRVLEEALRNNAVPYVIVGGLKFYERKEIKDLIAYLKIVVNPDNQLSLLRIINVPPRRIGQGTIAKIEAFARENQLTVFQALPPLLETQDLMSAAKSSLTQFIECINKWRDFRKNHSIFDLLKLILKDSLYLEYLEEEKTELVRSRVENVEELLSGIRYFENENEDNTLEDYLDHVSLLTDIDDYSEGNGAVTLMTFHSAKGLEFPVVFMSGMEKDLFPLARNTTNEVDLEEERRLCYVGMTRAKKKLILTRARQRTIYGQTKETDISCFVREIPSRFFSESTTGFDFQTIDDIKMFKHKFRPSQWSGKKFVPLKPVPADFANNAISPLFADADADEIEDTPEDYKSGDWVFHEKWGKGIILYRQGEGDKAKVSVSFSGQKKKLIIKYAKLKKIQRKSRKKSP